MNLTKWNVFQFTVLLALSYVVPSHCSNGNHIGRTPMGRMIPASFSTSYVAGTLGPLYDITNWATFQSDLARLKANGHTYISTDIWWGKVEAAGDNSFSWSYYQTMAGYIQASGLKWVPILSTHTSSAYAIPSWLNQPTSQSYTSIYGSVCGPGCTDYVLTPWYNVNSKIVYTQYQELYASFASTFASTYASIIIRVDVSGGPSGEIRAPSYTTETWAYPSRGQIMVYNSAAVTAFQNAMLTKHTNLAGINAAWGTSLTSITQVTPPCNTMSGTIGSGNVCAGTQSDTFFAGSTTSNYGKDFLGWYQTVLLTHAASIKAAIHTAFTSTALSSKPIGIKVAAVHWLYNNDESGSATYPHTAEYCAGYYNIDNYAAIISALGTTSGYQVALTGTEINDACLSGDAYSCDQTLSNVFFGMCGTKGVTCNAENALSIGDSLEYEYGNERTQVYNNNVNGLSILRYDDMTEDPTLLRYFHQYVSAATLSTTNAVLWFFLTPGTAGGFSTSAGDNLYISGSVSQLGSWSTGAPAPLMQSIPSLCSGTYCPWSVQVTIPNGINVQFSWKLLKMKSGGTVCWQTQGNNVFTPTTLVSNFFINAAANSYGIPSGSSYVTQNAVDGLTPTC